jgi:hypothetical protein
MTRSPASASAPGASPATEALRRILWRLDDYEQPAFTFEEVRRWPAGQLDRFVELGLVRDGGLADATIYYDCEQHCEIGYDPQTLPNGRVVVTHRCMHGCGLVVLEPERFRLWNIRFDGLANWTQAELGVRGELTPVVPGRVSLLGPACVAGRPCELFIARGLRWPDAPAVLQQATRLTRSGVPVVLVPAELGGSELWPSGTPATTSIAELLSEGPYGPRLDLERFAVAARIPPPGANRDVGVADVPVLTQIEADLLEALAQSPHETMLQVDLAAAAGYSKSSTREGLTRLRELKFVAKPPGKQRKGDAITAEGRAFLERRSAAVTGNKA